MNKQNMFYYEKMEYYFKCYKHNLDYFYKCEDKNKEQLLKEMNEQLKNITNYIDTYIIKEGVK